MKLIDKDALVTEIERLKTIYKDDENIRHVAKYNILVDILSFLDTLEVKEIGVDIDSTKGDWSSNTVQFIDADDNIKEITFNKAQKGE